MDTPALFACLALLLGCGAYIFWPQRAITAGREKTRLDYLRERRDVIYDNLRDLNFEFRAGKFPEEDYASQRENLEAEAAEVLAEMDVLEASA
jgi:flagellar motility protein MotE (MotC chaperone)